MDPEVKKLLAGELPVMADLKEETKQELAKRLYPGVEFDLALPQPWLTNLADKVNVQVLMNKYKLPEGWTAYLLILKQVVWGCGPTLGCFGRPMPLTVEANKILLDFDSGA